MRTDEGGAGAGGSGNAGAVPDQRKAEGAVVDQVHSLDDRVKRLETPFYERLFKEAEPKPPTTPAAPAGGTAAAKPKSVIDELGECMDPFGLFDERPPPKAPEAPVSDDAAA